ncbi:CDP-alcohol phosphatidyltransferase family protein [Sphingomonas sp.]|jgi:phosphatidylglycerophosphate synthase|uniref:CDP-alcohol phosphatidyltransferase family protein n=1 Tax=Sphingomonas sp. TaxID=28214 RepID=UPI002DEEB337|nr:CDP-alcohol phosphatidyltransferase family protein [Sphingomonas sp.]HEV2567313.1 CDP-alcohol phosphatidyltransferase family protein [Sphingomonas sp.]
MENRPTIVPVGDNPTKLWGMTNRERIRRLAGKQRLSFENASAATVLLVSTDWAFDPTLLRFMAGENGAALVADGRIVMAHVPAGEREAAVRLMEAGELPAGSALRVIDYGPDFTLYNNELRKRERPFLTRLVPENVRGIERDSYFGAYKGVTDILTKYLWPEWALVLTRIAARIGMTPNMVTAIGAVLCVLATFLFWEGHYWWGMAAGLGFMVLDTVDGKLARCTITSSAIGNVLDHGLDLVHPPFWWWAWGVGLSAWGLAYTQAEFAWVMAAILSGYVVQRIIEGIFMRRFGMHIHVWEKIDSDFRLITARRNPNMVILFFATLAGRPDIGLTAVAVWTVLSCIFHGVRLVQAEAAQRLGRPVESWLR